MAKKTMKRDLPEELVEEILCRVPATHLKRLRSTCKRWKLLFNNQRFATKHSDKAPKELMSLMLTADARVCPVSLHLHGTAPSLEVKSALTLIDPLSDNSGQFDLSRIFHCDGILVCPSIDLSRLVVWNPCTGQTRWIRSPWGPIARYVLGYTHSKSSTTKTYKVLCFCTGLTRPSRMYDLSSVSWRLHADDISPGWSFGWAESDAIVSLNGNAYWLATAATWTDPGIRPGSETALPGIYVIGFDFSSEKSSPLVRLPYPDCRYETVTLSHVRQEKLSVLLLRIDKPKTEIWVTNKIDESSTTAKPVTWSLVFALDLSFDLQISSFGTFLLDEEKKLALCCVRWSNLKDHPLDMDIDKVYCVGEGRNVAQVYLRVDTFDKSGPAIFNYAPSLVQIEPFGGYKSPAPPTFCARCKGIIL